MALELWLAFAVASGVLLIIPGPTIVLVISHVFNHGKQAIVPSVVGVAAGDALAFTVSVIGLGALLSTSAFWFGVVKIMGAAYLIYLGVSSWVISTSDVVDRANIDVTGEKYTFSPAAVFWQSFVITSLNPKGIVFFVAFLPQFIDPGLAVLPQWTILGITFVVLGGLNAFLYSQLTLRANMLNSSNRSTYMNKVSGAVLVSAGLWALSADRAV